MTCLSGSISIWTLEWLSQKPLILLYDSALWKSSWVPQLCLHEFCPSLCPRHVAGRYPSITCPVLNNGRTDMVSTLDVVSRDADHKVENSGFDQCAGPGEPDAKAEKILVHPSTFLRAWYSKRILKTKWELDKVKKREGYSRWRGPDLQNQSCARNPWCGLLAGGGNGALWQGWEMKQNGTMKPSDGSFKYQSRKIEAIRAGEYSGQTCSKKAQSISGAIWLEPGRPKLGMYIDSVTFIGHKLHWCLESSIL